MRIFVLSRIFSRFFAFCGLTLVLPLVVSLIYGDGLWWTWLLTVTLSFGLSVASIRHARKSPEMYYGLRRREGLLAVTVAWLSIVTLTSVAYYLTGEFEGFASSFFESMSGYTTTGATVARDVEALSASILFARSLSHWIGGMGIIVLSVAILPELAVAGMQLVEAETSGLESEKLAPRIADTARKLWGLYVGMTLIQAALLVAADMSAFDAINHAMATIATGGFSTRNLSIAAFESVFVELIVIVFMFLSGLNFILLFRATIGREPKRLIQSPEVRLYSLLMLISTTMIAASLVFSGQHDGVFKALLDASFQTVSIMTTTGFGTTDFDQWPSFAKLILLGLMFIGGCAGSTAGGSKVVRLYVVAKHAGIQMNRIIRPKLVQTLRMGKKLVSREIIESVLGFYLLYFIAILVASLVLAATGLDIISAFTAAISAMNSIGPGLGQVGPSQTFSDLSSFGLYVLSFCMLLGRLEIYTLLVLLAPRFWKR